MEEVRSNDFKAAWNDGSMFKFICKLRIYIMLYKIIPTDDIIINE